jgi:hypothetical protein
MIAIRSVRWPLLVAAAAAALAIAALATRWAAPIANADTHAHPIVALHGYGVDVFARGGSTRSRPDSVVTVGDSVYVGFQNATAADGSDGKSSTVVEYTGNGRELRHWSLVGRNDGLRFDPASRLLWATVNEDANSSLYTIDPASGTVRHLQFSSASHGGGYDDLAFTGGRAFVAASNPTLDAGGVNRGPAIVQVQLVGGVAQVTPVLRGDAQAVDTTTGAAVALNLTDPDSLTLDPAGDVVLVDQADSEIVTVHGAGTTRQTVTRTPVGTQLDDTAWVKKGQRLFVADTAANTIYTIESDFQVGTVFTEAPSGSGVQSWVGLLDPKTGNETPVAVGFTSPSGLVFGPMPGERGDDSQS